MPQRETENAAWGRQQQSKGIDGGLPLFDVLPFKERILGVFEKSGVLSRLTKHRSTFQMIMDV